MTKVDLDCLNQCCWAVLEGTLGCMIVCVSSEVTENVTICQSDCKGSEEKENVFNVIVLLVCDSILPSTLQCKVDSSDLGSLSHENSL